MKKPLHSGYQHDCPVCIADPRPAGDQDLFDEHTNMVRLTRGTNAVQRSEAIRRDKKGDLYVDEEGGSYGVFGTESGFCYGLFSDEGQAKSFCDYLRKSLLRKDERVGVRLSTRATDRLT